MIRTGSLIGASLALALLLPAWASAARLTGSVTAPDGSAIGRARIVLESPTGPVRTTRTADDGRFALEAPPGTYLLRILAEGFSAAPRQVALDDSREVSEAVTVALAAVAEQVVVSAGLVPVTRSSTGASITVIGEDEIRTRQLESSVDALRSVPGVTVSRSGGRGAVTSIFPRGGESDFTLVLVDGIRLNDMGGSFDAAHLPLFDLEQIEVVRGPQSALYGADAIGGVVQLVTRRGGPLRAAGVLEGGSFGTWRVNGSATGAVGRLQWGGGLERLASNGFTGEAPGTGETVSNDDYMRTDATASLGYQGEALQVTGLLRYGRNDRGVPGPFGSDPGLTYSGVDRTSRGENETLAAGSSLTWRLQPSLQVRGAVSVADRDSTFLSQFTPDDPTSSGNQMLTGRAQLDAAWRAVAWTAGGEWLRERARSAFITGLDGAEVPIRRSQLGLFGEARAERGPLSVQAGVRIERISRDALEANRSVFSPRPSFPQDTRTAVNPRLSASWRLAGSEAWWARLRGNVGTGIRAPGAFEIAFTDNPGLQPERSVSVDAGVETGWLGGRLVTDALYFRNSYDDLIVTVGRAFANASIYRSDNISNARAEGVEVTVSVRPVTALTIRGGYVGQRTEILANDGGSGRAPTPFSVGDRLLRRPAHGGFADLMLAVGRASGFVRVDGRAQARDIDPSFGANAGIFDVAGFTTVDAGVTIGLRREIDLVVRATNLLDRAYEEIFGFPSMGRSVMAGVRLATGR
ncbi:MAG: TonB-dependent receptor [Luteitalea sp.]